MRSEYIIIPNAFSNYNISSETYVQNISHRASYLKVTAKRGRGKEGRVWRGERRGALIRRLEYRHRREAARAAGSTRADRGRVVSSRIARATVSVGRSRVASSLRLIENRQLRVASASVARVGRVCVAASIPRQRPSFVRLLRPMYISHVSVPLFAKL